jgi:hypothetical protein
MAAVGIAAATGMADKEPGGVLTAGCGICGSIVAYSGVNLIPPEAA